MYKEVAPLEQIFEIILHLVGKCKSFNTAMLPTY